MTLDQLDALAAFLAGFSTGMVFAAYLIRKGDKDK